MTKLTQTQRRALQALAAGEKRWRHPAWMPDVYCELANAGLVTTGTERGRGFARLTEAGHAAIVSEVHLECGLCGARILNCDACGYAIMHGDKIAADGNGHHYHDGCGGGSP